MSCTPHLNDDYKRDTPELPYAVEIEFNFELFGGTVASIVVTLSSESSNSIQTTRQREVGKIRANHATVMTLHWWMHWFWVTTLLVIVGRFCTAARDKLSTNKSVAASTSLVNKISWKLISPTALSKFT
ncbi:unnamed protein product [Colias eurytheme]|nr:unnamed protein product [Colias eurytheme]